MAPAPTLADLVAPLGVSQFLGTVHGQQARLFGGHPGRFAELLPWPALNAILRHHRLGFPRLRLAHDGGVIPGDVYIEETPTRRGGTIPRLRGDAVIERLRGGATLVVDAVEELHDPIGELAARLEHELREHVQVNLYASWGTTHGFDVHWDDHDVLVLQVHGRKRWRLHGTTRPAPMHRDVESPPPPSGPPLAEHLLTEGDVLYVPRGHWHDVSAIGEPSLHLTAGFTPATGVDLVAWLADQLRADERFRRDLPRWAPPEARAAHLAELRSALEAALGGDAMDRFLADRDAHAPARERIGLPWVAGADPLPPDDRAEVRLLSPRALLRPGTGGTVELLAAGQRWVFAEAAAPVLEALLDGTARPLKQLFDLTAGVLDPAAVRELLATLTVKGLVAVEDAAS